MTRSERNGRLWCGKYRISFCTIPFFFKGLEGEQERKGIGKEKKNEEVDNRYLGHSIHSILTSNWMDKRRPGMATVNQRPYL